MNVGDIFTDHFGRKYEVIVGGTPPPQPINIMNKVNGIIEWGDLRLIDAGETGRITWQYSLIPGYLKLGGQTINDFSVSYQKLLDFFNNNSLIASTQADYNDNKALCYYDSGTDVMIMPDFLDKTVWGGNSIEEKEAGLPNINGSVVFYWGNFTSHTGAITPSNLRGKNAFQGGSSVSQSIDIYEGMSFNASQSNPIYGNSTTVQPPAISLIPQIKT